MVVKKVLVGTGILIGVYLLVSHATDAGRLIGASKDAYVGAVRVLQGR